METLDEKEDIKKFSDYKQNAHHWITLASGDYYPDILRDACALYTPVLTMFGQMVQASESSIRLFSCFCLWIFISLLCLISLF